MELSNLKKTFYFTGIFAFIGMLLLGVGQFYVVIRYCPHLTLLKSDGTCDSVSNIEIVKDPNQTGNPTNSEANIKSLEENSKMPTEVKVSPEYYLGEITNFYGNVIVILFSTIGLLLAISFIYVYTVSRGKAEELARQALTEESFQITLKDKIGKSLAELINEGEVADWLGKMAEFEERIDFLEKVITKENYENGQLGEADKLEGSGPNGGNKTI